MFSPFLLSELARVLRYPRVQKLHKLDDRRLGAHVQALQTAALVVNLPTAARAAVVAADPDDDPVIATAVAGHAEVLCTLDRHLRTAAVIAFCSAHGIQVLTDIGLLHLLRAAGGSAAAP